MQLDSREQPEIVGFPQFSAKQWALRWLDGTVSGYVWIIGKATFAQVVGAERLVREWGASKEEAQDAIRSGLARTPNADPDRVSKIRRSFLG